MKNPIIIALDTEEDLQEIGELREITEALEKQNATTETV